MKWQPLSTSLGTELPPSSLYLCEVIHSTLLGQTWRHTPLPRDPRADCEWTLDYIFLWFFKSGVLYCLFPACLFPAHHFRFSCSLIPLLGGHLVPLNKPLLNEERQGRGKKLSGSVQPTWTLSYSYLLGRWTLEHKPTGHHSPPPHPTLLFEVSYLLESTMFSTSSILDLEVKSKSLRSKPEWNGRTQIGWAHVNLSPEKGEQEIAHSSTQPATMDSWEGQALWGLLPWLGPFLLSERTLLI